MIDRITVGQYLTVDPLSRKLQLNNEAQQIVLKADIGIHIPTDESIEYKILHTTDNNNSSVGITWSSLSRDDDVVTLNVSLDPSLSDSEVQVYNVEWVNSILDELSDSFELSPHHWYGGSESYNQRWPIESDYRPMWTYTTADIYQPGYGNVMERYWLCSSRVALTVEENVPLLISLDENRLRVLSRYIGTIYSQFVTEPTVSRPVLKYKLWLARLGQDLKTFHECVIKKYFDSPRLIPDQLMMKYPIWTTWARYKSDIDQDKVLKFVQEISEHNFQCCQIEIDDGWARKHGDLEFDFDKFPNPKRMIDILHKEFNVRVTLWIHPFVNLDSKTAMNPDYVNFWVSRKRTTTTNTAVEPVVIEWWNGKGYALDVTNPNARLWFLERLKDFQIRFGFDSFKFDAGEVSWLTNNFQLYNAEWPNQYTTEYANMACEFGSLVEARCNSRNQNAGNFLRIMDKDSRWGYDNGLKTLIPCALLFSVLNRPYVLPDIVGGNAYPVDGRPDRELYIRWVQTCVFMPAVQFSITPWDFDPECVETVRKAMALRQCYVDKILIDKKCTDESTENKIPLPIVRPLWWMGDESEAALNCDSQFMFGNDILVAPVLDKGQVNRSVYLPRGYKWKCPLDDCVHEGGQTILQRALIDEIPFYLRVKDGETT